MRDSRPKFKSRVIEMLHSEWKFKRFGNFPLFALAAGLALMICGAGISDEEAPAARYLVNISYNIDSFGGLFGQIGHFHSNYKPRAIIHYGEGSADAGGQVYPQVVVVDEDNNPLPADKIMFRIPPPIDPQKGFKLLNESVLTDQRGIPDGPPVMPLTDTLNLDCYRFLPLLPEGVIEPPDNWEIDFRLYDQLMLEYYPAMMRCEILGREEKFGIPCIVIHFNLYGKAENQVYVPIQYSLGGMMVNYTITLSVDGTLHYDPASRTVITKEQTGELLQVFDSLAELQDGTLAGWVRVYDLHSISKTNIHLVVDEDEQQPE